MSSWLGIMSIRRTVHKTCYLSNWHVVMSKYRGGVEKRHETLKCQCRSLSMCIIIIFRLRFVEHRSNICKDNLLDITVTCKFDIIRHIIDIITCLIDIIRHILDIITCLIAITACRRDIITCQFDIITCQFNIITCQLNKMAYRIDIQTCHLDIITCQLDIITHVS